MSTSATFRGKLKKQARVLRALNEVDSRTRAAIVSSAKKDLVTLLVDCAKAIINRRVPLTRTQSASISRSARDIARLTRPRLALEDKKRVLQSGGTLPALIGPILGLLPTIVGGISKLVRKGRARRRARLTTRQQQQQRGRRRRRGR